MIYRMRSVSSGKNAIISKAYEFETRVEFPFYIFSIFQICSRVALEVFFLYVTDCARVSATENSARVQIAYNRN